MSSQELKSLTPEQLQKKRDEFWDCLWGWLLEGWASGLLMAEDLKDLPDLTYLLNWVYPTGESVSDLFEKNLTDLSGMERLIESEGNRLYNEGVLKAGEGIAKTKTWRTMGDERVRDLHWYLEDVTIPFEEEFVTYNGDSALAPGRFSDPSGNANCRCYLEINNGTNRENK